MIQPCVQINIILVIFHQVTMQIQLVTMHFACKLNMEEETTAVGAIGFSTTSKQMVWLNSLTANRLVFNMRLELTQLDANMHCAGI